jgi:hypothetical protein
MIMHQTIVNILKRGGRTIISRVSLSKKYPDTIEITDDGDVYTRYWGVDDLIAQGGENWAAEGGAYKHIYLHSVDVPLSIQGVL